jgi:hypothetical protein
MQKLIEIQQELAERRHIDDLVAEHQRLLAGNGKPGFASIRDKVLSWDGKLTALSIVVVGDLITRLVQFAASR